MWNNIDVFGVLDVYVLCCSCLLGLRGGPFFFKIPLQAKLTAVSSYYGAMVPPTCLGYRFERWPILTYCPFNVKPSYLGNFYPTVQSQRGQLFDTVLEVPASSCSELLHMLHFNLLPEQKDSLEIGQRCEWVWVIVCPPVLALGGMCNLSRQVILFAYRPHFLFEEEARITDDTDWVYFWGYSSRLIDFYVTCVFSFFSPLSVWAL